MTDLPKLMTVQEVAGLLDVHPETVRQAVRNRKLAHYRFGGVIRIGKEQVADYLAANLCPARDHTTAKEAHAEETSPVADFQRSRRFTRALVRRVEG